MRQLTFFDMARSSDVKRWHILNTVRPQTVAEHSFMVALIALEIANKLLGAGSFFDSPREEYRFLCAALFHDMPETVYGDLPTPGKMVLRDFMQNPRMFDELDMVLMPNIPYAGGLLNPKLGWVIKIADLMESYHFLCSNASGPYAKQVRDAMYGRLIDLTSQASTAMPDLLWPSAVIETLKGLGLTKPPAVYGDTEKDPRV